MEAMASRKPVIAPNELIEAAKETGKHPENYKNAYLEQAEQFDISNFIEKIRREIEP